MAKKKTNFKTPLHEFTHSRNWTKAILINIRNACAKDKIGVYSVKERATINRIDILAKQLIDDWDNNTKEVIEEFKTKNQNI